MRIADVRKAFNHSGVPAEGKGCREIVSMTEKEIARVRDFTDEGLIPYGAVSSAVPPQTTLSVAPGPGGLRFRKRSP